MKKLIKSGPGAGYDVTVKGIELDDRNFKILKDEIDERYGFHDVTVEVPVKPCVAEYWSAEAYYDAIDSKHDYFDPREDSKIEGGKAVLFFNDVNVDEGETLEDAIERIMPSELDLTMMYGGGWSHANLPEDGIHFDDGDGRHNLDVGEVYDYETISCDLVCPNICQDINAFFENPEEYYDDYIGSSRKAIKSANDYGWEVDSSEVPEALDLFVEYVGKETALEEIARAMGTDVLEENLDWVIRQWGFAEDVENMDDIWEKFEHAKEVMGTDELYENLIQAAGHDELAEDLAFIFRQYDFREWDERNGEEEEEIESACHGKGKKKGKKEIKSALENEDVIKIISDACKMYNMTNLPNDCRPADYLTYRMKLGSNFVTPRGICIRLGDFGNIKGSVTDDEIRIKMFEVFADMLNEKIYNGQKLEVTQEGDEIWIDSPNAVDLFNWNENEIKDFITFLHDDCIAEIAPNVWKQINHERPVESSFRGKKEIKSAMDSRSLGDFSDDIIVRILEAEAYDERSPSVYDYFSEGDEMDLAEFKRSCKDLAEGQNGYFQVDDSRNQYRQIVNFITYDDEEAMSGSVTFEVVLGLRNDALGDYLVASLKKEIKSMARQYMKPQYDARKSFYNKAETDDDKLYSYGTLVAEIVDGEPVLHDKWDFSATTIRHVKEWLQQNGFEAGTKQEIGRKYKKAEN